MAVKQRKEQRRDDCRLDECNKTCHSKIDPAAQSISDCLCSADKRDYGVIQTENAVKPAPGRKFVYVYYPEFDTSAHRYGVAGDKTANVFAAVDAAFAELLQRLSGTDTAIPGRIALGLSNPFRVGKSGASRIGCCCGLRT